MHLFNLNRFLIRNLVVGLCVGFSLAAWLSVARILMISNYWPNSGAEELWPELSKALLMGARFDLKVSAIASLLCSLLLGSSEHSARRTIWFWSSLFAILTVINFYYYGFYKVPIDSVIFGIFDDDTKAVLQTIWSDFPIIQVSCVLAIALLSAGWVAWFVGQQVWRLFAGKALPLSCIWWIPVLLALALLTGKGTLKGMALQPSHLTVTSKPFLNGFVPNGVISLYYAWRSYSNSTDVGTEYSGLSQYGFQTIDQAVQTLGWVVDGKDDLQRRLRASGVNAPNGKNLVLFQMESWSAEPFLYQSAEWDMLSGLKSKLSTAWLYENFDSAGNGTIQSLEAIMYGTPISPIAQGRYRHIKFDWSLPSVFKKAGYDTLFITSGKSGWRELNRVMPVQGFDEVVDAATLQAKYPEAQGGIWGVWDSYMTRYIEERLAAQTSERPLFVYAMSTTNHGPFEIPEEYPRITFDISKWPGENTNPSLLANLQSYRYANDVLADFVAAKQTQSWGARTLVAATGDHNVRAFGMYAQPEREVLFLQVPFVIWGAGQMHCPQMLKLPASHLDMFPTLFPLLGIHDGYLLTGRNLADCSFLQQKNEAVSVTFFKKFRTRHAIWQAGESGTLACQPVGSKCEWQKDLDAKGRARVALLDWNVRRHINNSK